MNSVHSSSRSVWGGLGQTFATLFFVAYAMLILAHVRPPVLGDLGEWAYEGILLRVHLLGQSDPAHLLKHYPVPNSLTTLGIGTLSLAMDWKAAVKTWLCLYLALAYFSSRFLIRRCKASGVTWFLLPMLFLSLNLWWGFLNFQFGICFVLIFTALLYGDAGKSRKVWLYTALLTVLFFTHMIPFAFASLLLLFKAVQTKRLRMLLAILLPALLTVWYVAGRFFFAGNADAKVILHHIPYFSAFFAVYKAGSFLKSFGFVNPLNDAEAPLAVQVLGSNLYVGFFLCSLVLCGLLLLAFARGFLQSRRHRAPDWFAWMAGVIFLVVYLFSPSEMLGIADPGARLLQVALYSLVFFLAIGPRAHLLVAACSTVVAVCSLFLFVSLVFTGDQETKTTISLPSAMQHLASVKYGIHAEYYTALDRGNLTKEVFPTAMFLNTPDLNTPSQANH